MNRFNYTDKNTGPRKDLLQKSEDLFGCPKCHKEQICGCRHCVSQHPDRVNEVTYKWGNDGESLSCGHCGYTMSVDAWQDREWDYYKVVNNLYPKQEESQHEDS
jgi:transcription elongation factor Elf1